VRLGFLHVAQDRLELFPTDQDVEVNIMTPLRQRFVDDLRLRNYSPRTIETYVRCVAGFAKHFGRSPELLGADEIRTYQLHLVNQKASWTRFNQIVCALRFLYRTTLDRSEQMPRIPYGKKPKTFPCVFSPDEVAGLFAAARPGRERVLLQTTYACGLRRGDLLNLEVRHIDSPRMVVHVHQGKGHKDRLVPLSLRLLAELRDYWRRYRPTRWLFPNASEQAPLCGGTANRIFHRALRRAQIRKPAGLHTLRHSFATHMLEAGADIFTLQKILGHTHVSTTMRYLHLRSDRFRQLPSLLDLLPLPHAAHNPATTNGPMPPHPGLIDPPAARTSEGQA
jgi:integrase/recombinase XerD